MTDQEYLQQFPVGSQERRYHEALLRIVRSVKCPDSEKGGQALLRALEGSDFVNEDLDTRTSPSAGSLYEDSLLVAHVFQRVNPSASWWKSGYEVMAAEDFSDPMVRFWLEAIRRHPQTSWFQAVPGV